ncbi:FRG domain-containing protein [Rossellomorea sp. GAMAL-10_SWC]
MINSVSEYINQINTLLKNKKENQTIVFRGENDNYPTPCQPNIFRENILSKNKYFEKNLFDEMSANKITDGGSYLEKAIDAQHGGFPSRLLDVTYNCLVALYFAVTPGLNKPIESSDSKSGVVYIFFIDKVFCPSGNNINSIYNSIINRDKQWFNESTIFQKNHKLIDHFKSNKRIIAQQGAFILFQGDDISPMPESDYKKLIIPGEYKKDIRAQLEYLFGIHTGSIYPEPANLVNIIKNKSYKIHSIDFHLESEFDLVILNFNREIEFFKSSIINKIHKNNSIDEVVKIITKMEEIIYSYKLGFEEYSTLTNKNIKFETNNLDPKINSITEIINIYNDTIDNLENTLLPFLLNLNIELSTNELKMESYLNE